MQVFSPHKVHRKLNASVAEALHCLGVCSTPILPHGCSQAHFSRQGLGGSRSIRRSRAGSPFAAISLVPAAPRRARSRVQTECACLAGHRRRLGRARGPRCGRQTSRCGDHQGSVVAGKARYESRSGDNFIAGADCLPANRDAGWNTGSRVDGPSPSPVRARSDTSARTGAPCRRSAKNAQAEVPQSQIGEDIHAQDRNDRERGCPGAPA